MSLRRFVIVPVATLAVLASVLVAHATAPGATIKIAPNATLANPPNSVIVDVDYSCQASSFGFGNVSVDQSQMVGGASGSRIDVIAYGYFQPVCDDKTHHASVVASIYYFFGGSFVPGTASASAFVGSGTAYANTSNEITIK
jgi:hypothetical protein